MLLIACGDEQSHFERQETMLVVSAPPAARIRLFRAGDDIQGARELDFPATRRLWPPKGRYFLRVEEAGQTLYYPVAVVGFRAGPDRDGTLKITVRPAPSYHLPDFSAVPSGYVLLGDNANPQEQHYVWVSAYAISIFEVTNSKFKEFLFDPAGFAKPENWTKQGRDWMASNHSAASALMSPAAPDFAASANLSNRSRGSPGLKPTLIADGSRPERAMEDGALRFPTTRSGKKPLAARTVSITASAC
jgi:hypothetical protein